MKSENLKEILPRLFALVIATVLLACCAVLFIGKSGFGWFSQNQTTQGGGTQISLISDHLQAEYKMAGDTEYLSLLESGNISMAEMGAPGDTAEINVRFTNLAEKATTISEFGIFKPTQEEELPKTVDGVDYYLSTQITVSLEQVAIGGQIQPAVFQEPVYLGQMIDGTFHAQTINLLTADVPLGIGEYCEFTIKFTFVNKQENQNQYKGFGDGQGICTRKFYASAS